MQLEKDKRIHCVKMQKDKNTNRNMHMSKQGGPVHRHNQLDVAEDNG
jgi:hypothetical protein